MNEQHSIKMSNPKLAITTATMNNTFSAPPPNQMVTIDDTTTTRTTLASSKGNYCLVGCSLAYSPVQRKNSNTDNCNLPVDGIASPLGLAQPAIHLPVRATSSTPKTENIPVPQEEATLIEIEPNQAEWSTMNLSPNSNPAILTSSAISSSSQTNLVRKHSCGDLVSRLKSRKILGVGENSEHRGEVYRSKISQLLGHSEHLFTRFPVAFWHWYACLILVNVLASLWNMFGHLVWNQSSEELRLDRFDDLLSVVTFFRQFIGIFYFAFAALLWRFFRINDKSLVRYVLLICSAFSLAKIILILYYDHCNVVHFKNWLISSICPSKCTLEEQSQLVSNGSSSFLPHCSHFSSSWSSRVVPHYELVTYLALDTVQVLINLWYRHRMLHSGSGSSSMLASSTMTNNRRVSGQDGSLCEYLAFLLHAYLLHPIGHLFSCSTARTTTPNMSTPTSPTSLKPPEENIEEETVEEVAHLEAQNVHKPDTDGVEAGDGQSGEDRHSHQQ